MRVVTSGWSPFEALTPFSTIRGSVQASKKTCSSLDFLIFFNQNFYFAIFPKVFIPFHIFCASSRNNPMKLLDEGGKYMETRHATSVPKFLLL